MKHSASRKIDDHVTAKTWIGIPRGVGKKRNRETESATTPSRASLIDKKGSIFTFSSLMIGPRYRISKERKIGHYFFNLFDTNNTVNIDAFIITIVAPVGKFSIKDKNIPVITDKIEIIKELTIIFLKLSAICKELIAGNIIRLDINIAPTIFTPITIVID
jgi:hypothetical protein